MRPNIKPRCGRALFQIASISSVLALAWAGSAHAASVVSTFDELSLSANSHYFPGAEISEGNQLLTDFSFESGGVKFAHVFTDYRSDCCWSGWSYTNHSDTVTAGPANQYSAFSGGGHAGSANYVVSYNSTCDGRPVEAHMSQSSTVSGAYFTATTYSAQSMLHGDARAKPFGGPTGDDPDYFKLTISGYNGSASTGSVDFYLADYRFEDNSLDYIVDEWTFVDLSGLGTVTHLGFTLVSSDVGPNGTNTPLYFAMDSLMTSPVPEPSEALMLAGGLGLLWPILRRRRTRQSGRQMTMC